jgi:TetR/AcrR family transcriptional regulator, cholesterol catabolism regulator
MPLSTSAPQAPDTMSSAQLARRQRLIDAVVELVGEGRDEDVQMKDIAERADVALGTVYRYFSSKDHLLAAALLEWAGGLDQRNVATAGTGAGDRLAGTLHQALRAYRRQPTFARVLVFVANSPDPYASQCFAQLGVVVFGTLTRTLDGVDAGRLDDVLRVVGAVWYHAMSEWVKGRMDLDQVTDLLDTSCRLLLG